MGLPVAFLFGLIALFAAGELGDTIPGSAEPGTVALAAPLLLVPLLLVLLARRAIRRRYVAGRHPAFEPEPVLRVSGLLSPLVVYAFVTQSGYDDLVYRASGDGHLIASLLTAVPLVLTEVPRLVLATQVSAWRQVEVAAPLAGAPLLLPALGELLPLLRLRLSWVVLICVPWVLLELALDLLAWSRPAYALVLGVSFVMTGAFLLLLAAVAAALPVVFRRVLGLRPLPEHVRGPLRAVARALDFDPDRIYLLPTGETAMNAMMVGPLRCSRLLCLTDGLLLVLDSGALCGVVAHEVGHARRGHPMLLVMLAVVIPVLLLQPLPVLPIQELAPVWQVVIALPVVLLLWAVVRTLAHRFELEADVESVKALGAGPCSRALLAVSHAAVAVRKNLWGRLSTLHPEESTRLQTMLRYEQEGEFRARFEATGRRLRVLIGAAVACAFALALWAWCTDWKYEYAIWRLWSGDVVGAAAARAQVGDEVPERWRETWRIAGDELRAAREMAPAVTTWAEFEQACRRQALPRAIEALEVAGAAAARPWIALAADASRRGDADWLMLQQLYELGRAMVDEDAPRAAEIWEVMRRRPVPAALRAAVLPRLLQMGAPVRAG